MDQVSNAQKRALDRASRADGVEFIRIIYSFLVDEKREGESIDPSWADLYERKAPRAKELESAPEFVFEKVESALKTIVRVDKEVRNLSIPTESRLAILLGAGASAPPPSSIPTVADLLPELWRRAKKIGRDDIDRLAAWCDSHSITNIEDLLTAAYVANFCAKIPGVTGLLDYFLFRGRRLVEPEGDPRFRSAARARAPQVDIASIALFQDTLQTLFGLLTSTMIPARPNAAHSSIANLVTRHRRTSIITTNYDGCIDEALIQAEVPANTYLGEEGDTQTEAVDLVKMHGSVNWSYCDSCQEVRQFALLEQKKAFEDDRLSYAVIGICRTCGGQRRPLLVPPLAFKFIMFPNLITVWSNARRVIEEADWLLVVGYSFSEADTYITKIISRSMTAHPSQRMIVCDPDSGLVPALRDRFTAHIDGFDSRRILRMVGSCDQLLPPMMDKLATNDESELTPASSSSRRPVRGAAPRRGPKE